MQKKPKPVLFDDLDLRHQCEQVLSYIIHFKDNSIRKRPTNLKDWPSWCWRDDFRIRYTQLFFTNTRFYSFCEKMVSLAQKKKTQVQVNLFQKYLFLHQLTHNMTKDCPLNYQFSTWKFQAQNTVRTCCVHKLFWMSKQKNNLCTKHVLRVFWAWNFHVLNW